MDEDEKDYLLLCAQPSFVKPLFQDFPSRTPKSLSSSFGNKYNYWGNFYSPLAANPGGKFQPPSSRKCDERALVLLSAKFFLVNGRFFLARWFRNGGLSSARLADCAFLGLRAFLSRNTLQKGPAGNAHALRFTPPSRLTPQAKIIIHSRAPLGGLTSRLFVG